MATDQNPQAISPLISQKVCVANYSLGHPGSVVFVVESAEKKIKTEAIIQAKALAEWKSVFAVEVET